MSNAIGSSRESNASRGIRKMRQRETRAFNLLCFVLLLSHHYVIITSLLHIFAFYSVSNLKSTAISAAKTPKSDVRQFQESWTADVFSLSVVMTEQYVCYTCTVHSAMKISLTVPPVLNVILKPNTKNYLNMIQRIKLLKRQFFVTKNKVAFLKVVRNTNRSTGNSYKVAE